MFKQKIFSLLKKRFNFPNFREFVYVMRNMKSREKAAFFALAAILLSSALAVAWEINEKFLVNVPADGGALTEGIVGTPRFINPLLAVSDADRDMSDLIYSGLTRADGENGLIPDLAEKYEISGDGMVYTFTLRPGLLWQDGEPITSDDVVFTVKQAKDPGLKSPKRANWEGIEVEKINERTLKFILRKPYAPFLENTVMGILPGHIWKNARSERMALSEFNVKPVGSGPYQVEKIRKDSSGIITSYVLAPNKKFALGKPHIEKLTLKFYPSKAKLLSAYSDGEIDSLGAVSPQDVERIKREDGGVQTMSLPRVFGVFFNQNNAKIFSLIETRKALELAADKQNIIKEVLKGFGTRIDGPLPPGAFGGARKKSVKEFSIQKAREMMERNGWKPGEGGVFEKKSRVGGKKETLRLEFSLATSNVPELKRAAELLKATWEEMGAKVNLKIFEIGDLNQDIIRPRKYDALLFGEIVGRNPDPFVFWHSSQRNDPGLNIAMYANVTVDKLLEEARSTPDRKKREEKYEKFREELAKDTPAIFLYSPLFIYIVPDFLKGAEGLENITAPPERFSRVHKWYVKTDKVWKIFAKKG